MIYLDNSATTQICDVALDAYVRASKENWGNPSSRHQMGKMAEDAIEEVRSIILNSIKAKDGTVIFTSNGTEANNLAIFGRLYSKERFLKNKKILTTAGEHSSMNEPLLALQKQGVKIVEIPTKNGELDFTVLQQELTGDVVLVSMMLVNNETGALYPLDRVSKIMKIQSPDAVLHVDATQGYMKVPITVSNLGCDMLTISSHKIQGPKGIGALYVTQKVLKEKALTPRELGGGQEQGFRSGTENVPGIIAFGEAIKYKSARLQQDSQYLRDLHDHLVSLIQSSEHLKEVQLNIPTSHAPHILSITLPQIKSETMLHYLSEKEIYVSSGSACSSHNSHLSSAMLAYGLTEKQADCTIRVSLGVQNTEEDLKQFVMSLEEGVGRLVRIR